MSLRVFHYHEAFGKEENDIMNAIKDANGAFEDRNPTPWCYDLLSSECLALLTSTQTSVSRSLIATPNHKTIPSDKMSEASDVIISSDVAFLPVNLQRQQPDTPHELSDDDDVQLFDSLRLGILPSENVDDQDERGRPSSRWWETSPIPLSESSSGMSAQVVENVALDSILEHVQTDAANVHHAESPLYIITEPTIDHQESLTTAHILIAIDEACQNSLKQSTPFTPPPITCSETLDVSRLANALSLYSQPSLASVQTSVELLEYRELLKEVQDNHSLFSNEKAKRDVLRQSSTHDAAHGVTVKEQSTTDESQADLNINLLDFHTRQDYAQNSFEVHHTTITKPRKAAMRAKLHTASKAIARISESLQLNQKFEYNQSDLLLEKLMLLKSLYNAREQCYKELFDLQTESNVRYEKVVLAPYSPPDNALKMNEARKFFCDDYAARLITYRREVIGRSEQLLTLLEKLIDRSIEGLSFYFVELALSVQDMFHRVSRIGLNGLKVEVPQHEDSSYHERPLRYLYRLLLHAEKLLPQLIASQAKLLQLLTGTRDELKVSQRTFVQPRAITESDNEILDKDIQEVEKDGGFIADLNQRVEFVKEQWEGELRPVLTSCKENLEDFLVEYGGPNSLQVPKYIQ